MFDARSWLSEVTEAARLAEAESRYLEARMMLATRIGGAPTTGIHTGITDPMKQVDALIDAEQGHSRTLKAAMAEALEARTVFAGMRSVGSLESRAASMLELVHVDLLTKKDAAEALGISYDSGKRSYTFGVEWLDAHGIAAAKSSMGIADYKERRAPQ